MGLKAPIPLPQLLDLNAPAHNGLKYADFIAKINRQSVKQTALDFGVSRKQVHVWKRKLKQMGVTDAQGSTPGG